MSFKRTCRPVALLLSLILGSIGALVLAGPASAIRQGAFSVGCDWSHSLNDDPIMHPGDPGGSDHRHAFFGNKSTDANSTRRSMLHAGTTCGEKGDTAGVWAPTAIFRGRPFSEPRERTYYFRPDQPMGTLASNIKIVGGNMDANSPAQNPWLSWSCGKGTPEVNHPYNCRPYRGRVGATDGIVGRVDFPWCWDGRLDSPDHLSQVIYPDDPKQCPADHHRVIPQVSVRVHTGIWDPCAGQTPCGPQTRWDRVPVKLAFSNGPWWQLHADFWNTWNQKRLSSLIDRCLRRGRDCGVIGR